MPENIELHERETASDNISVSPASGDPVQGLLNRARWFIPVRQGGAGDGWACGILLYFLKNSLPR
jgi:hypothetical protein